jgi:type I restriction-modification system DNA methylase subunit
MGGLRMIRIRRHSFLDNRLKEKDYNLNVSLYVYVFPVVEEEKINLAKELKEFKEIEEKERQTMETVISYIEKIVQLSG